MLNLMVYKINVVTCKVNGLIKSFAELVLHILILRVYSGEGGRGGGEYCNDRQQRCLEGQAFLYFQFEVLLTLTAVFTLISNYFFSEF
jgi:hypothetical protein